MESYPFICLIFTFFVRERLGWVHTFALRVNKLLLEFWDFQLVSCYLHCLLHWHCSDNFATAHIHSWVKKRVQSSEKAEKYGLGVKLSWTQRVNPLALFLPWSCTGEKTCLEVMGTVMQPLPTGTCSERGVRGASLALLSFVMVFVLNKSTFQKLFLRLLYKEEKNETTQTHFQRPLYYIYIYVHTEMYIDIYVKIYIFIK